MTFYEAFTDELEKLALTNSQLGAIVAGIGVPAATTLGLTGLAIYDHVKGKSIKDRLNRAMVGGRQLGEEAISKRHVAKVLGEKPLRKEVQVVTTERDMRQMLKDPVFEDKDDLKEQAKGFASEIMNRGDNAAAFVGDKKQFVIVPQRANKNVIEHELGHLRDFGRRKYEEPSVLRQLTAPLWWGSYRKVVMEPEERAWSHVRPDDQEKMDRLRAKALRTYERGFHEKREDVLKRLLIPGAAAGTLLTALGIGLNQLLKRRTG